MSCLWDEQDWIEETWIEETKYSKSFSCPTSNSYFSPTHILKIHTTIIIRHIIEYLLIHKLTMNYFIKLLYSSYTWTR